MNNIYIFYEFYVNKTINEKKINIGEICRKYIYQKLLDIIKEL